MPVDAKLAARVKGALPPEHHFVEKKMFGGLAYLLNGKMCCGILGDRLVARIGPDEYPRALKEPHVSPMDFTGRPLTGYVYVESPGTRRDTQLRRWLERSIAFVSTLKTKKGGKRRRTLSQLTEGESARELPLSRIINFGPVTLREFKAMGLTTYGQLEDLGWESVCRQWVEHFPGRLNVNAFIGVIATLEGISWTQVSASDRARARGLASRLRQEYGAPVSARKPRRAGSRR